MIRNAIKEYINTLLPNCYIFEYSNSLLIIKNSQFCRLFFTRNFNYSVRSYFIDINDPNLLQNIKTILTTTGVICSIC